MPGEPRQRLRMVAPLVRREARLPLPVRAVTRADLEDLAVALLDAYRGTIDFAGTETLDDARAEVEGFFAGEVGQPLLECSVVALDDDCPIAASLVTLYQGEPLLAYTFTAASWKGRGLARGLVQLSMNLLASRGHHTLALIVTRGNLPAIRVYEQLGFVQV